MKNLFTYKNIVTLFAFITIWSIMFLIWQIHITSDTGNRYQIVKTDDNTILLDKRSGLTWRNIWNNNKDKIPSDWEAMSYSDKLLTRTPIGEQKIVLDLIKNLKKDNEE